MNGESSKNHPHGEENKWQSIKTTFDSNFFLGIDGCPVAQRKF